MLICRIVHNSPSWLKGILSLFHVFRLNSTKNQKPSQIRNPIKDPYISGSLDNIWGGVGNSQKLIGPLLPHESYEENFFLPSPFLQEGRKESTTKMPENFQQHHQDNVSSKRKIIKELISQIIGEKLKENYYNKVSNR